MSRLSLLCRAFVTTLQKVGGEVRRIRFSYWVAMTAVAVIGDLLVLVTR